MHSEYWFKLKEAELVRFVNEKDHLRILYRSLQREPGKHDPKAVVVFLNKARTIWVQSIHFYGGEHFGQPYCFVAEIGNKTTNSAFVRWARRCPMPGVFGRVSFTY